jgi:hypothetical protein
MGIARIMMGAKTPSDKIVIEKNIWNDFNGVISRPTYLMCAHYNRPIVKDNRFDVPCSNNNDIVKITGATGSNLLMTGNYIRNSNLSDLGQLDTYTGGNRAVVSYNSFVNTTIQRKQGHEGSTAEPPEDLSFDKFLYNDFLFEPDLVLDADRSVRVTSFRGSRFQVIGNTYKFPDAPNANVRWNAIFMDSDPTPYGDDFQTRFPQMFNISHNVADFHEAAVPPGGLADLRFISVATDATEGVFATFVGNMMLGNGRFIVSPGEQSRAALVGNVWKRNPNGQAVVFDGGVEAGNAFGDVAVRARNHTYGEISGGSTAGRQDTVVGTSYVIDLNSVNGSSTILLGGDPGVGGTVVDIIPVHKGQTVTFIFDSGTTSPVTFANSGTLRLAGNTNFTLGNRGATLTLTRTYRDEWVEISRSER